VVFDLYGSANTSTTPDRTVAASTTAAGVATASTALALDVYRVVARLAPGTAPYFAGPDATPATLTVVTPASSARAFGAGWVTDPSYKNLPVAVSTANKRGSFAFSVKYSTGKTPQGGVVYTFRGADGYDYLIASTGWAGGSATFTATTATLIGQASVIVVNPATHKVVPGLGGSGYTFRVDVTDNAKTPDTFALTVAKGTALYHQVGTTTAQLPLGAGGLTVSIK